VTLRIVSTPLATRPEWPASRAGGFDPTLREAIVPAVGTESIVAKLAHPDVLVVTTGQQPALFTGPLYTIHKALSARALAQLLEARWQRPVVPLFWLAGDDHDFAEARTASWLKTDGSVATGSLLPRPADANQLPMYRTLLGAEIEGLLAEIQGDISPYQFSGPVREWLSTHWRLGRTLGEAYAGSLAELFAPLGILCFNPTHRAAKRMMARHLIKAVGLARDLERDLVSRAAELAAIGLDGGVVVGDGATLVMVEGKEGRDRLVVEGDHFATRRSGEPYTIDSLQTLAAAEPERLSPNVLLRPVIEAAILPTVAYVAGPGELNYWRLTPPIFARMRIAPQAAIPRWSGMVVEPGVDRLVSDLHASLDELLAPGAKLEARLARSKVPAEAAEAMADLQQALARDFDLLERTGVVIAPQLARSLATLRQKITRALEQADLKVIAHLKRRDQETMGRIQRARDSLRPNNRPQERVLTVAPFLARHGTGLLPEIGEVVRAWYAAALEAGAPTP
jgi:bacillithiol biosynthesis cysteine-adding enzyme BshC